MRGADSRFAGLSGRGVRERSVARPEVSGVVTRSRKEFLVGAGGLLLFASYGCGGGGGEGASGQRGVIEHKHGSTEIPEAPERIVTVGLTDQDPVLALGVTPVGTTEWFGEEPGAIFPWARDYVEGETPEVVGDAESINFESVAALEPDLILGLYSGLSSQQYETLSEIAPVIAQPGEYADYGVPWQEQTRRIGRALGREERADELIAQTEGRFEEAREQNPRFEGASGVVASFQPGYYYVYGPQDSRGRFMRSLGFEIPGEIAELAGDDFGAEISRERLDIVDADALVWLVNSEEDGEELRQDSLYGQLEASREERDLFLINGGPLYDAFSFSSVLSLPFLLDEIAPDLAAAVDGDPATRVETTTG